MKATWKTLAARIDSLGLRERGFLFLAVILICVALVDAWWVSPERLRYQQARQQFDANTLELQQLRDASKLDALKPQPAQLARDELARLQTQLDAVSKDLLAVGAGPQGTTSLPDVMRHFLRRYPALSLVRTGNLPAEAVTVVRPGSVARQGLELTVAGPYADLVRLVQTLETTLPDLRWGKFKLQAEQQPSELTLQVFLVGARS